MPDQPLRRDAEARLLEAVRQLLREGGLPNPDRAGCPDRATLRALALHKADASKMEVWADHLTSCSPCFLDYEIFRQETDRRKTLQWVAVSALLVIAIVGLWRWTAVPVHIKRFTENILSSALFRNTRYRTVTVDLRNRFLSRGEEETANPRTGPVRLPHTRVALSMILPLVSPEGSYDVKITRSGKESLLRATGIAHIEHSLTVLRVRLDLNTVPQGFYLLGVRHRQADWEYYPVIIR
ncbi:MAG TPA: hypothetical protein VFZ08_14365 [Terriglobia bacterium]|nr:hypothetical protein [Terriglobia bacterium]